MDRLSETEVRRVNVIVYANYGEPNARIIHGRDHDLPDIRTKEHNQLVVLKIGELAAEARSIIEDKEHHMVDRIKGSIREYYQTKSESAKKDFEQANNLFPFLFSRAWMELKSDRAKAGAAAIAIPDQPLPAAAPEETPPEDVLYPLDAELRDRVMEIERIIIDLGTDLHRLKQQGNADDILLQTCRKLVARAKESLSGRDASEFSLRRLDMTRNSLLTTWRQVRSRLKASQA